jgi:hypothetical protein
MDPDRHGRTDGRQGQFCKPSQTKPTPRQTQIDANFHQWPAIVVLSVSKRLYGLVAKNAKMALRSLPHVPCVTGAFLDPATGQKGNTTSDFRQEFV